MRAVAFASMFVAASAAQAQVTLDSFAYMANVNRTQYSLTVGAGSNRALVVWVHAASNCGTPDPSVVSVTYAGVPLVRILTRPLTACTGTRSELWALPPGTQPTSGTNLVDVILGPGTATTRTLHSGAMSATGVDQTTTFSATAINDGNGSSATVTLGASGANDLVVDGMCAGSDITSTPQTSRWLRNETNYVACDNSAGATADGGTTSLSWTVIFDRWIVLAAALRAAPAQTVALDAVASIGGGMALSYPLSVGSAANRAMAVFTTMATSCGQAQPTVTGVTYAGLPLLQVIDRPATCIGGAGTMWSLPAGTEPPTGTDDVVVTLSGPVVNGGSLHTGAFAAAGVDQTNTFSSAAGTTGNGTPVSLTLADSGALDLVVDAFCNGTIVNGTQQSQKWITNLNSLNSCNTSGGATAPGGTTVLTWDGGHDHWLLLGASFKAFVAPDAGGGDAGSGDGGSSDAGGDGGSNDGGSDGGGPSDGGLLADGGDPDAGNPPEMLNVGCGCTSSSGFAEVVALLAYAVAARRRRADASASRA